MRFNLVDRVEAFSPGKRIVACKALSRAEEYLADHFPAFPVMPGVLMLETLVQSAAWLVRASEQFAHSMVVLAEARNVRYASFVQPGQVLRVEVTAESIGPEASRFRGSGLVDEQTAVSAKIALRHYNLAQCDPAAASVDEKLREHLRGLWAGLKPEEP